MRVIKYIFNFNGITQKCDFDFTVHYHILKSFTITKLAYWEQEVT